MILHVRELKHIKNKIKENLGPVKLLYWVNTIVLFPDQHRHNAPKRDMIR